MRTQPSSLKSGGPQQQGIALIMVMVVITFLGIIVAGFAYSMKVETKLARNSAFDPEMDWLGRSGLELAKYVLGQQRNIASEPYDSLNQKWAGGPGNSNSPIYDVTLENNHIGRGTVSVKIIDCERKLNINTVDEMVLRHALLMIGVDSSEAQSVANSILDWRDPDDQTHQDGAETDFYEGLEPPYVAKNGPLDDIHELLLIKGVTPEMFFGPGGSGVAGVSLPKPWHFPPRPDLPPISYANGLKEVFTPFSTRFLNLNTVAATVLQMLPEIDENTANSIIQFRAGPDGSDGTLDDMPFRTVGMLAAVPGVPRELVGPLSRYFATQSAFFEVEVTVDLDKRKRTYYSVLRRVDVKNVQTLYLYSK